MWADIFTYECILQEINIFPSHTYCLSALNKIMDLIRTITQSKTMRIKNPAFLLNTEFDSLLSRKAGLFVGIGFEVVYAVQRSLPIQNLAKSRPNFTGGVI